MPVSTLDDTAREAVISACAEVRDGGADDHVDGIPVGLIARPEDTDQVAEVLRAAAAHRLAVVPHGRGTKSTWGAPPAAADVVLDLSALDQVVEHAAGDLIAVAQAGARLSDLQEVVAQGGQRLNLDETVAGASIGGTLATNASGPLRVAAGTARDLLIGVTVVRADGVVAKAGGRVVKNVAGYDLGKLIIGSFGTLAVVTEAVFRLHPVPAARRWVSRPVSNPAQAQEVVQAALHGQAAPAAIEVEWPAQGDSSVHVLLEGREDGVDGRATTVAGLLGGAASQHTEDPYDAATYPWDTDATGDDRALALKLTFVLSGLADVLSCAREMGLHVRGSAGAGVAYAALPAGSSVEQASAAVQRMRETCMRVGGSTVVLDAPLAVKQAVDVWGPVPAIDLMRRVKDQFDPDHRLSPGRFVGGL